MIPRSATWKNVLADAVRDPAELLALLELPHDLLAPAQWAARDFPLRVPRPFVARMAKGDPHDPLLRQILPLGDELNPVPGFTSDPVGDLRASSRPGLLHKYQGRVLLVATGACAVHCRYCFRRHFPYADENPAAANWAEALAYIAADSGIEEVILSGGDPLLLDDRQLATLSRSLAAIPQVQRLRLHTRLPIVLPERVTDELLQWLSDSRLQPVVVVHANHPREIDADVAGALARLRERGIPLFNQSVLLHGVNDDLDSLCRLSNALFRAGVTPYYLHLLDRVRGGAHFEVSERRARELLTGMRRRLPGYLVPRLVREVAGAPFKVPQ